MSNSDPSPLEPVVFRPAEEFTVERVFPIRNLVGERAQSLANSPPSLESSSHHASLTSREESSYAENDVHVQNVPGGAGSSVPSTTVTDASSPSDGSPFLPPPWPPIPPEDTIRRLPPQPDADVDVSNSSGDEGTIRRRISERVQMVPARFGPPGIAPGSTRT